MRLQGKTALITGGSRGLGLDIARALGAEGAAVALMARAGSELSAAVGELGSRGVRAIASPADVTRSDEVERATAEAASALGGLDLLVLNAGTWQAAPLAETTEAQWDLLLDLNLKGAFLGLKHAIPHLVRRGGGTVVGICSLGGHVGQPGSAAYAASKWGLRGLLESAALELSPHRIRVSIVSPHNMNSAGRPIDPAGEERRRTLETADVAALVAHICSAPAHVAIGNATIWPATAGIRATG